MSGFPEDGDRGSAALLVLLVPFGILALILILIAGVTSAQSAGSTACSGSGAGSGTELTAKGTAIGKLDDEQMGNATRIVRVGAQLGLPASAARIAVAVAMQESGLRNLDWGDRDSVGLFQQRAAWGSVAERTTPTVSATMFYTGGQAGQPGLIDIDGWASMPLTAAAWAVQRSATPNAYAAWAGLATAVVAQLWPDAAASMRPTTPSTAWSAGASLGEARCSPDDDGDANPGSTKIPAGLIFTGTPAGQTAARFALAQLGKPYRWAAAGPEAYDCSGLTMAAWKNAGHSLPHFTGAQVRAGVPVPGGLGQAVSGDLVFIPGLVGTVADPRHVGMVVGTVAQGGNVHLWIVHASQSGHPIALVDAATWTAKVAAVRRIG